MTEKITWDSTHGEVTDQEINEIEKTLNVTFPLDYLNCAKFNNGGYPSKEAFDFEGRKEAVFSRLLSYHKEKSNYILNVYQNVKDRLINGIVPIADDPFGNLICLDYRQNVKNPKVIFWDHEIANESPENAVLYVADSFSELLSKLYE